MPAKKTTTAKKKPAAKKCELTAELEAVKERITEMPNNAEFRQARKYLIMYARTLQDIISSRKK